MVPAPASICAADLVRDEGSPGWACPLAATRRHRRNRAGLKLLGPARGFVMCRLAFPPSLGTARRQEPSQICVNVCAAQCGHRARRADKASIDVRLKTDAWSHSASQSPASRCPPSPPPCPFVSGAPRKSRGLLAPPHARYLPGLPRPSALSSTPDNCGLGKASSGRDTRNFVLVSSLIQAIKKKLSFFVQDLTS